MVGKLQIGNMTTKPLPRSNVRSTKARRRASKDVMTMFMMKRGAAKALAGFDLPADAEIAIVSSRPDTVSKIGKTLHDRVARVAEVVARDRAKQQEKALAVIDKSAFEPDARSRAVLAGIRIAQEDLRDAGGAYDLDQVRTLMRGVSRQAVDKRVQEGSLIAVPGPSNRRSYPTVQFTRDGAVVPGLKAVREALQTTNPWTVLNFLINPDTRLNERRPIELLQAGEVATVVDAAMRHGEHGARRYRSLRMIFMCVTRCWLKFPKTHPCTASTPRPMNQYFLTRRRSVASTRRMGLSACSMRRRTRQVPLRKPFCARLVER
jgi:hypothetical protein